MIRKIININHLKRVGLLCLTLFSVLFIPSANAQIDTTMQTERIAATVHRMPEVKEHSPKKALILSAVLPGAGQVYNKQAWKIPIIYAAFGGVGYYTYSNYTQMKYYKDEYIYRVNHNDATQYPDDADMVATPTSNIYNMYQTYDKTFQLSVIIAVAVYGINLLDAYVYGHLFDFQISDDLTLNVSPMVISTPNNNYGLSFAPVASLRFRF